MCRYLDIGPGYNNKRIEGFETLDIVERDNVDHVADASEKLPFDDNTFDVVHASHILEHIDWKLSDVVIKEWARIIKNGGQLEVWVPDILKVCRAFVNAEDSDFDLINQNKRALHNEYSKGDPCRWLNGRVFSFTDTHKALFSKRYLTFLFENAGLFNIRTLTKNEIRSNTQAWFIQLGLVGIKRVN